MERTREFQYLIGNHLHNSLFAALDNPETFNCKKIKIVKNTDRLYYPSNCDIDVTKDYNPKDRNVLTTLDREVAIAIADTVTLLNKEIGNKIAGIILHGSQSNNTANADSDIDIFILLKEYVSTDLQMQLRFCVADEVDLHFSTVDYFWNSKSTVAYNILRKGLLLWVA